MANLNFLNIPGNIIRIISMVLSILVAILGVLLCLNILSDINPYTIWALVVGVITVVCGVFGFLAALKRHQKFLLAYVVLCGVCMVLSLITIVLYIISLSWGGLASAAVSLLFWGAAFYFGFLLFRGEA